MSLFVPPAPRIQRIAAATIDALVSAPMVAVFVLAASGSEWSSLVPVTLISLVPLLGLLAYQTLLLVQTGQSVGKRLLRLVVVKDDGSPLGLGTVALRSWAPLAVGLAPLLVIGALHIASAFLALFAPSAWRWLQGLDRPALLRSSAAFATVIWGVDALFALRPSRRCLHDDLAQTDVIGDLVDPVPVEHWRLLGRGLLAGILFVAVAFVLYVLGVFAVLLSVVLPWLGHIGGG